MQFISFASVSLLLICSPWEVESRRYISKLTVTNGEGKGEWGEKEFCRRGYAYGFFLKVQAPAGLWFDNTGVNGITLHCTDGDMISSSVGPYGSWTNEILCKDNFLDAFSLRVSLQNEKRDQTGVNNIKFMCTDGTKLDGLGMPWGEYGEWSEDCNEGGICGIQTRVDQPKSLFSGDTSGLSDVTFFCCA